MSQDSALSGDAPTLKPTIWAWPVAAGLLAAWPVWRSLFPEVPDVGEGWSRLQPALGLANALLFLAWMIRWRARVYDLSLTLWSMLFAVAAILIGLKRGDVATADLGALVVGWMVAPAIFAALVLIRVQQAGLRAGCRAPHRAVLFPPILWLSATIAVALLVTTFFASISWASGTILAIGVVSPGLILAWASLSDTAKAILATRQVYFSDATSFQILAGRRRWLLRAPTILLGDRVKLASLHTNKDLEPDIKPGELVGLAAAATMEEESDIGRAIQEFGVTHRIRLPALRQVRDGQPLPPRQALLASGVTVELCAPDDGVDLSAHAEAIELAQAQHRAVMAVVERAPNPRLLGILVFAIGARAGAAEALRALRDRRIEVALSAPARDLADEIALKSLNVKHTSFDPPMHQDVTSVWRGGAEADVGGGLSVAFGGVRPKTAPSAMHLVVGREDARALVDLARFADDFRTRTRIVTLLASAPGLVLIASAFGYVPVTPFLVTGVAVIGILIATLAPQVLRLSPVLDNEGTEE